ncbi:MAG: nucleotide exchange factor GrpE [Candidatus Hodarchaeota archaeon]
MIQPKEADTIQDDELERLKKEVAELKALANEHLESRARMQADFDNFRKIKEKERKEYLNYGNAPLIRKLLKHREELEKGIQLLEEKVQDEKITKGFEMIKRNLESIFNEEGVKPIDTKGKLLDPNKHEVVHVVETNHLEDDMIYDEIERGYMLKDRVLRPAKVIVSKKVDKLANS